MSSRKGNSYMRSPPAWTVWRDHTGTWSANPQAATEDGGNAAPSGPRISEAPSHCLRSSLRLPDSSDAAGLRSGYYLAMQPLPQQLRANRTPKATYPICLAQDSPGSFQYSEISQASPPMPERKQGAEVGLRAHNQSNQTQSTSWRT